VKKIKIEDIILTPEQKEALHNFSGHTKNHERRLILGFSDCIICGNIPTKKVSIDVSDTEDDIKSYRIETYCKTHFDLSEYFSIHKF
jgi:hypothetical protein